MSKSFRVAVAGAGIAGLASAIALARAGHKVTVFEKAAAIDEIGAGIQIGPNAVKALQGLGVWDDLRPQTVAPAAIVIGSGCSGKILTKIELAAWFEQRYGAPYRVAHRADLIACLHQATLDQSSISIMTNSSVDSFAETADEVLISLASGATVAFDALVGADGVRSTIRSKMFGDGGPNYAGQTIFRALLPVDSVPQEIERSNVQLWLCPGGHIVHYPVSGGRNLNIVAAVDADWTQPGWRKEATVQEVLGHFATAADPISKLLGCAASWHKWAACDRKPLTSWHKANVVLTGDAAHPCLPYLAQGAAMALEDAVVLGQLATTSVDPESIFNSFEVERLARTNRIATASRAMARTYHMRNPMSLARDLVIRSLPGKVSMSRLSWIYDWQPLRECR